jgi:hypothetical protein
VRAAWDIAMQIFVEKILIFGGCLSNAANASLGSWVHSAMFIPLKALSLFTWITVILECVGYVGIISGNHSHWMG